ncbi:hypothetical protein ACJX0J_037264, partial [Zea mays]
MLHQYQLKSPAIYLLELKKYIIQQNSLASTLCAITNELIGKHFRVKRSINELNWYDR